MSKTRIILRVVLVGLLLGMVGWIVALTLSRDQPEHYWRGAQGAMESKDWESAIIHLKNLVMVAPDHGDGHHSLAKAYVAAAATEDVQIGYGSHSEAYKHIVKAAELLPEDLEVQEQAMLAHLARLNMDGAAEIAEKVIKQDSENVNALYALTWRAVEYKQSAVAEELFPKFEGLVNRRPFRTLGLMARHYGKRDDDKLQQVFGRWVEVANHADAELLASFSPREYDALDALAYHSLVEAHDASIACDRMGSWFAANEKLVKAKARDALDLAATAARLSEALATKGFDNAEAAVIARRDELGATCRSWWDQAIAAETSDVNVYRQAASAAFHADDVDAGNAYLDKALAQVEKIPSEDKTEEIEAEILQMHLSAARSLVARREFKAAERHIVPLRKSEKGRGWGELLAGSVASSQGRHEKALNHYEAARRELGDTVLVRIALGNTYLAVRRWEEALGHLSALHGHYQRFTHEERAWAEQYLGTEAAVDFGELRAKLALGDWEGAQDHLRQLKGTPLEPNGWLMAVAYLWTKKELDQAVALLNDARRKFPADLNLARFQLFVYAQTNHQDEGTKFVEAFAAEQSENLPCQLMLCQWRIMRGEYAEADKQLEELISKSPESGPDRLRLLTFHSHVLLKLDRPEEALAIVEQMRNDPAMATPAAANVIGAAVELKQDNLPGALAALNAAEDAGSDNGLIPFLKGRLSVVQGDYEGAIESFSKSINVTSLRDRARAAMLQTILRLAKEKSPEVAIEKVNELLEKHPDDAGILLARANLEFQRGKADEGLAYLDRISETQPESATGPYLKATALAKMIQFDKARRELEKGLKREPRHVASLLLLSQTCLALQRNADGLDYAAQAVEINPRAVRGYFIQVEALKQLKRDSEAITLLAELIKSQPNLTDAYLQLAVIYLAQNQAAKALEVYTLGRKALPDDLRLAAAEIALFARAKRQDDAEKVAASLVGDELTINKAAAIAAAYFGVEEMALAQRWAGQVLTLAKKDSEKQAAHLLLGDIAMKQGQTASNLDQYKTAQEHYAAVLEFSPTHLTAGNNLAWLLAVKLDQPDEAIKVCETVRGTAKVEQLPVRFVDTMAAVYRKAGKLEDAEKLLRQAMAINPNHAQINFQLGLVLADSDNGESRDFLRTALKLGLSESQADEANAALAKLDESKKSPPTKEAVPSSTGVDAP